MALKIWTFLLVMSLPAAEHGHGFGSLAAVLSSIDYHQIQQNGPYYNDRNDGGKRSKSITTVVKYIIYLYYRKYRPTKNLKFATRF